jgi:hypothetical protein
MADWDTPHGFLAMFGFVVPAHLRQVFAELFDRDAAEARRQLALYHDRPRLQTAYRNQLGEIFDQLIGHDPAYPPPRRGFPLLRRVLANAALAWWDNRKDRGPWNQTNPSRHPWDRTRPPRGPR